MFEIKAKLMASLNSFLLRNISNFSLDILLSFWPTTFCIAYSFEQSFRIVKLDSLSPVIIYNLLLDHIISKDQILLSFKLIEKTLVPLIKFQIFTFPSEWLDTIYKSFVIHFSLRIGDSHYKV